MKNNKNGLIAFALLGLAAGAAAYYLLSTDDGKQQLNKANSAIKDLTKTLKDVTKKEAKKASKLARSTRDEFGSFFRLIFGDQKRKRMNSSK